MTTPFRIPQTRVDPHRLARVAIFPLSGVALFPHAAVPLHIFEPRYRQMVADALAGDMLIALTLPTGVAGDPLPVHDVAGVGHIVQHELLADGRYNIVLKGLGRIRVVHELASDTLYRVVEAAWLEEVCMDVARADDLCDAIQNCIFAIAQQHARIGGVLVNMTRDVHAPNLLADSLSAVLFPDALERQQQVEALDVTPRLQRVLGRLGEILAHTHTSGGALH